MIKRVFVSILLGATLFGAFVFTSPVNLVDACGVSDAKVYVYCKYSKCPSVTLGNGVTVVCAAKDFANTARQCDGIDGVSIAFDGDKTDVEALCKRLRLQVYETQILGGITIWYGYSQKVDGGILLDGKIVNVQIALSGDVVSVGSPLILGSY